MNDIKSLLFVFALGVMVGFALTFAVVQSYYRNRAVGFSTAPYTQTRQ